MNKWPDVALGELIAPAKVRRAGTDEYPLLSMTMRNGLVPQDAKFTKRVASTDTSNYKVVKRGQLVVGFPIDEGVLDFQLLQDKAIVSPAYGIWDLKKSANVHIPYLARFLRSDFAIAYYSAKLRGSTARRRSLPAPIFLELQVPLPPLDEQRRIAAILDQGQRNQERMHLILNILDKFQESIFETMFGQGGSAKESSTVSTIGSQLKLKSGEFLPASSQQEGAYPVYGGNGINGFHCKYIFDESMIVIGRVGAQCGAVHLTRPRAWVTDNALVATEIDTPIDRLYLRDALSAANLNQFANRSGQPSISQKRIANVPLLIPSPESQNAYRFRLSKIDEVRTVALKNIELSHELLRSLQTRAFRGEL